MGRKLSRGIDSLIERAGFGLGPLGKVAGIVGMVGAAVTQKVCAGGTVKWNARVAVGLELEIAVGAADGSGRKGAIALRTNGHNFLLREPAKLVAPAYGKPPAMAEIVCQNTKVTCAFKACPQLADDTTVRGLGYLKFIDVLTLRRL